MPSKIYNNQSLGNKKKSMRLKKTRGKTSLNKNRTFRKKAKKQKGGNVDETFLQKKKTWQEGKTRAIIDGINIEITDFNISFCKFKFPSDINPIKIAKYTDNFEDRNAERTTAGHRETIILRPSMYSNSMFSSEKEKHSLSVEFFNNLQLS